MHSVKKSRQIYLHSDCNQGKIAQLDLLQVEYANCLRINVDTLLAQRRFDVKLGEKKYIFPSYTDLTSNIRNACQAHATAKVSGWVTAVYTMKLKSHIQNLVKAGWLTREFAKALYTIGKHSIDKPWKFVTQEHLNFYWDLLLSPDIAGRLPNVSIRDGMWMTINTGVMSESTDTKLTNLWLKFSHLKARGERIQLPLVGNPSIKSIEDVSKGIQARKTKQGRWCFQVVEKQIYKLPDLPDDAPTIGIDVGQNVLATTSNGDLFGTHVKPRYLKHKNIIKDIRANRQRQGLNEDSARVIKLDTRLIAYLKTECHTVANQLVRKYPNHKFVVEDLNLSGVSGDRRFGDTRLINALKTKAHTISVNPAYTSQECPSCVYVSRKNRHGTKFHCRSCGRVSHADVVGAINVLRRSKDKQIDCDDNHKAVGSLLSERFLCKRNSSLKANHAPSSYGQRLTVGSGNTSCIASNLVANY